MKVLGKAEDSYDAKYIVEISTTELRKLANLHYKNEFTALKVGEDYPISSGYDFRADITAVCEQMVGSMLAFEKAKNTLLQFALMVSENNEGD